MKINAVTKLPDKRDYVKVAINATDRYITFAMFISRFTDDTDFKLIQKMQNYTIIPYDDIKKVIFEDAFNDKGVSVIQYADILNAERKVIDFGDGRLWFYTSSMTYSLDGIGEDELDEIYNIIDICFDPKTGILETYRTRMAETKTLKTDTYRHKALINKSTICNLVSDFKPKVISDFGIYIYNNNHENIITDFPVEIVDQNETNMNSRGGYIYDMIKFSATSKKISNDIFEITIKSTIKNTEPYKLEIESDSGYLPIRNVVINKGVGKFKFMPLYLEKGYESKIKISSLHRTSLVQIKVLNE